MKIVVFISGRGSNLEALLQHQNGYEISHVIANKKHIKGFDVAHNYGVTHSYIDWRNQAEAEKIATEIIEDESVDLIVLAGFMKILSAGFVARFHNKIINIHPSLLPDYPGLNTHQRALDDHKLYHGASVHFVDNQLDHGQVISQTRIKINEDDTANSLAKKLIIKEHKLLVHTVGQIAQSLIYWQDGVLYYDNKQLKEPLLIE